MFKIPKLFVEKIKFKILNFLHGFHEFHSTNNCVRIFNSLFLMTAFIKFTEILKFEIDFV
jgi:hypothetical protein